MEQYVIMLLQHVLRDGVSHVQQKTKRTTARMRLKQKYMAASCERPPYIPQMPVGMAAKSTSPSSNVSGTNPLVSFEDYESAM